MKFIHGISCNAMWADVSVKAVFKTCWNLAPTLSWAICWCPQLLPAVFGQISDENSLQRLYNGNFYYIMTNVGSLLKTLFEYNLSDYLNSKKRDYFLLIVWSYLSQLCRNTLIPCAVSVPRACFKWTKVLKEVQKKKRCHG